MVKGKEGDERFLNLTNALESLKNYRKKEDNRVAYHDGIEWYLSSHSELVCQSYTLARIDKNIWKLKEIKPNNEAFYLSSKAK